LGGFLAQEVAKCWRAHEDERRTLKASVVSLK